MIKKYFFASFIFLFLFISNAQAQSISSFTPTSGRVGTSVQINGSGITDFTSATLVTIGGTSAAIISVTGNGKKLNITVGNGTTGNIAVTLASGAVITSSGTFTFIPLLQITSFTPTASWPGDVITITGTGFIGTSVVTIGGINSPFIVENATTILALVEFGARSGSISVTVYGVTATLGGFTIDETPFAITRSVTLNEDAPTAITLTGGGVEGRPLTYNVAIGPTNGALSGVSPLLTYTPNLNFNGSDSFTFTVHDGVTTSIPGIIFITVTNVNDAPTFTSVAITSATEDILYSYTITTNDPERDVVTLTPTTIPSWLTLSTGGVLSGTPTNLNVGAHNVVLTATDATSASTTQTFTITVTNVNDAPIATPQSVTLNEEVATPITLRGTDVDAGAILSYTTTSLPTKGVLSGVAPTLTYTPTLNLNGDDSFTFIVSDGTMSSSAATVSITITPVNDVPVATAQSVTLNEDTPTAITLAGTDVEGTTLTYTVVLQPTKGILSGVAPNLTYTPTLNLNGDDNFTFRVSDGTATSTSATVSITITAVNDPPTFSSNVITSATQGIAYSYTITTSDPEGGTVTLTATTIPSWLTLSGGVLSGTPTNANVGANNVVLTATDPSNATATQTFTITVTNVNDAPTFTSVAITSATEDILYSYTVTTSDPDGGTVTLTATTRPSWLTLSTDGVLSGTPTNANVGANNVVLTATDPSNATATQSFTITVTNVNDAPIATPQSVTLNEEVATPITLRGTDVDAGAILSYTTTSLPTKGVLSGVAPTLTYTPTLNLNGDDSFTFIVIDGTMISSAATVSITITPVNDVPVATAQSVTLNEDTPTAITLAGTDVEGTTLTYTVVLQPTKGILSGVAPNLTYTPTLNLNGDDSFTFTVSDGTATSTSATVSITITPVNDAPTFSSNVITSATQGIAYSYTITTSDPEEGVVTLTATTIPSWLILSTGGVLSGTPTNLNVGAHNVVLTATDATNASRTQTFTITVTNVNDAPIATAQSVTLNEDVATPIILSGTDVDAGTILTYTVVIQPTKGTISGNAPSLIYTPTLNLNGEDSFTFTVNDGTISSSAATVSITITPVNDVPVATAQSVTTAEDVATPITLAGTDVENSGLTYALITLPVKGRINGTPPNLTYIPNLNISGSDSLIFIANDGTTTSTSAKVSITITPVNDVPVATAQSVIINEDIATPITLRGADIDEGTALTYTITTPPTKGILSGDAPSLTFTPTLNLIGNESFTFTVSDGTLTSSPATISITINPVNDPPSFTKGENITVQQNSSAYSQAWGTNISKGGEIDENIQSLTFRTTNSNNTLFSSQPEIRSTGELRFTPATNQSGSAIITTSVRDNGGTANGGSDTSETQTFRITILSPTTIISFSPSSGITGTAVTIIGTELTDASSVKFGETEANSFTVLFEEGNLLSPAIRISAVIGSGATGVISVTTPAGTASSSGIFTFYSPPTITSLSSAAGGAGTSIIITGTNFTDASVVKFGGTNATSFSIVNSTIIRAIVGSGAIGAVSVTTPGGTATSSEIFSYNNIPIAIAQSVTTAEDVATPIILRGTDLDAGTTLTYTVATQPTKGRLSGVAPNLIYTQNLNLNGSDSLTFTVNDGTSTSSPATVLITINPINDTPVATASSITINEDSVTTITLTGTDVDEGTTLTYTVVLQSTKGTLSGNIPNFIFKPTSNSNGRDSITFTVSDGTLTSSPATISITINPVNDPPSFTKGSNVTVQQNSTAYSQAWGTNLSRGGGSDESTQSLTFITTNNNNLLFSVHPEISSTGELRFTPATNQSGSAIITTSVRDNGGTASGGSDTSETQTFTITILSPTTIISFTPSSGITGTVVIITGTNFIGTTSVKFGGTNASLFTVDNATSIRAIIGSGTSGVISITTPSGTASSTNLFTHLLIPTITSFSPNVGGAGTSVIITGTNFTGATIVKIGGVTVSSFTVDSSTTITAVVGSGATGIVSVTTPSGTTTSNNIFTYYPKPTITSFTPTIGITSTTITITGTNLLETNSVKVGGKDVSSFTVDNATSIQAVVGDVSTGTISVITFGGTATSSNIFSYYSAPTISSFAPASGTMGSTITITGTNLLEINSINFGGTPAASYNIISATSVTALIGSGNSGTISLVTPGGSTTSTNSLTFTQPVKEITITYPNGGENFNADSIKNIRWTSSGVLNVNINYSINAGLSWTNITSSTPSDGSYSWEIPDTASINCLIEIIDINNSSINDISDNIFTIYKQPVIITNNHKIIFGDTKKTTSFKMVSIPGDNNKLINHYLTGTHKTDWNVFWDNGGNSNFQIEFNGSETFIAKPGIGFWILSNSEMLIKETIKSVTLSDDATCSIPLHNNWNIIGSPFEINVNWANVRTKNSLLNNSIIYYWDGVTWAQSTIMEPFKAYFYFNAENKPSLKIPYPESPGGSALLLSQNIITISLGENKAYAVFDRKYKSSYDENDILYPLSGYENTAVCIINDSFNDRMKRMFVESRNNIEGEEFRIEVINKSEKAQSLRFNLEDYKFSNSIYLIDEKYGNVFDLRLKSEIIIPSMKDAKYYKLLVGSKMYINEKLENLKPKQFALHQNYPNPFNPTTTIKYDLPQDASTTITIYSILGQEVKTLVNGFEKAGFNNIVWDGTNDLGNKVATGVYIYKIRAGKFTSNKKMIMLK